MILVRANNLKKHFLLRGHFGEKKQYVKAVDGVSFSIEDGETFAIVGESGSGKTTVGRLLLYLIEPTGGNVYYKDKDIFRMPARELRNLRASMQMVFQDPYGSLNPRMTVESILREILYFHGIVEKSKIKARVNHLLELVGIEQSWKRRYPHEFSGGQRQRIAIARAICLEPSLIVADEPVSALDVSVRGQILNLLKQLQNEFNLAYLLIAHDLSLVRVVADRVAVMYRGKLVETAITEDLFTYPSHPYTKALMQAIPIADPDKKRQKIYAGYELQDDSEDRQGCVFRNRCDESFNKCSDSQPVLKRIGENHFVACHLKTGIRNQEAKNK